MGIGDRLGRGASTYAAFLKSQHDKKRRALEDEYMRAQTGLLKAKSGAITNPPAAKPEYSVRTDWEGYLIRIDEQNPKDMVYFQDKVGNKIRPHKDFRYTQVGDILYQQNPWTGESRPVIIGGSNVAVKYVGGEEVSREETDHQLTRTGPELTGAGVPGGPTFVPGGPTLPGGPGAPTFVPGGVPGKPKGQELHPATWVHKTMTTTTEAAGENYKIENGRFILEKTVGNTTTTEVLGIAPPTLNQMITLANQKGEVVEIGTDGNVEVRKQELKDLNPSELMIELRDAHISMMPMEGESSDVKEQRMEIWPIIAGLSDRLILLPGTI